jgi:ATP-dependent DNA ligase
MRPAIRSGRGNDWTDRVPSIAQAIGSLRASTATLDGEAVICDEEGISDFDALRFALARRAGSPNVFLYAFDLLQLDGHDLRESSWESRREALMRVLQEIDAGIRLSESKLRDLGQSNLVRASVLIRPDIYDERAAFYVFARHRGPARSPGAPRYDTGR